MGSNWFWAVRCERLDIQGLEEDREALVLEEDGDWLIFWEL